MTRFKSMYRSMDTRPIEALYSVLTLAWGCSLLAGSSFQSNPAFGPMAAVMPEKAWGTLALCIGFTRVFGLAYGHLVARLLAAIGGGAIWTFTWLTIGMAVGANTGVAVYGVLSVVNFIVFIKLCRNLLDLPAVRSADS